LVEAGPPALPSLDPTLSAAATRALEKLGVEVRLGGAVTSVDADGVIVAGERIEARTVVWAAGVMASPARTWLGAKTDRSGRVIAEPDLAIPGRPDIFVIGDAACAPGRRRHAFAWDRPRREAAARICREANRRPATREGLSPSGIARSRRSAAITRSCK
jgi:NADH dehydrogenase FAD-containing subunit